MSDWVEKRKATQERRKHQTCKVYKIKLDRSKLSRKTLAHLHLLFLEAKWFYNHCIQWLDLDFLEGADTTAKSVRVKVGDTTELRQLTVLSGQMKQDIKQLVYRSLKSIKTHKLHGHHVGRIRYKSIVNSIPLRQFGETFQHSTDNTCIRIQKLKPWLRAIGLRQITDPTSIANAVLVRKCNDFYLHVTTFVDKTPDVRPLASVGIDFGVTTPLTLSDGTKIDYLIPASNRIRRLDRRITREHRKPSNKRRQDSLKRQREYLKLSRKRGDIRHKIVHAITSSYTHVCVQDESIHAWASGRHGRKVHGTGIGGIIADLKHKSHTPLLVDTFFPSTQLCPRCGSLNKLPLRQRIYTCDCGYTNDRDVKAAVCIEIEAMRRVPMDHRDFKAQEIASAACFYALMRIDGIKVSKMPSLNVESLKR